MSLACIQSWMRHGNHVSPSIHWCRDLSSYFYCDRLCGGIESIVPSVGLTYSPKACDKRMCPPPSPGLILNQTTPLLHIVNRHHWDQFCSNQDDHSFSMLLAWVSCFHPLGLTVNSMSTDFSIIVVKSLQQMLFCHFCLPGTLSRFSAVLQRQRYHCWCRQSGIYLLGS